MSRLAKEIAREVKRLRGGAGVKAAPTTREMQKLAADAISFRRQMSAIYARMPTDESVVSDDLENAYRAASKVSQLMRVVARKYRPGQE